MKESETMTLLNKQTGKLETFNIHTGELVTTEGDNLPTLMYSIQMAEAICNLVREGKTYEQIAQEPGMPGMHLIYRWRNHYPEFAVKLKEARKDRATLHHDRAIAILEEAGTIEKEDVPREKFRFDGYMKLAERGSPDEFGPQTKVSHENAAPTVIMINTGIDRDQPVTIEGMSHETTEDGTSKWELGKSGRTHEIGAEIGGLEEAGSGVEGSEEADEKGSPPQEQRGEGERSSEKESQEKSKQKEE